MLNMCTRFTFFAVAEARVRNEKAKSPFHFGFVVFREMEEKAPACQARSAQKLPHNSLLSATYIHTRQRRERGRRREMCG